MRLGFYRRLAWTGIRQNKKMYLPYILACIGVVMVCYIVSFLGQSPALAGMAGGRTAQSFLDMGFGVMCVFSTIFLFYTNSFLIRRRKKEFGLYNILGMGKRHLALVLLWETVMIAAITLVVGLFCGVLFSKVAELALTRILDGGVTYTLTVELNSVFSTVVLFLVIFGLIFLNTLRQIHLTSPIALLRSENAGEKPPRANWIIALLGLVVLGGTYYWAITVKDPITAMIGFFIAVAMVVVGTYLLFVAGSVTLCRLLQKNKRYYYKTNHFVSVSSMVYRMKRNGAGLASICILCTMVLVMISSTSCLYIGIEDSIRNRYPRNINLDGMVDTVDTLTDERLDQVRALAEETVERYDATMSNVLDYRVAGFVGIQREDHFVLENTFQNSYNVEDMANTWQVFVVPLEEYNQLMGKHEELVKGEALVYTTKEDSYNYDTLTLGDGLTLSVAKQVDSFADNGVDAMQIVPSIYLFVPDFSSVMDRLGEMSEGSEQFISPHWFYGFDLNCDDETQKSIAQDLQQELRDMEISAGDEEFFHVLMEAAAQERADTYGLYGGLFFLGILLGVVFILAAVLIIYYKQICEGYEDQARFDIMQKVGMTKVEIRRSINSQVLTVFFLPLLMAGAHLAFAFPLIRKLLLLLGLTNVWLFAGVTVVCFVAFALFYVLIYRLTSRSYFRIVSGMRDE